jgi:hypothetical protein
MNVSGAGSLDVRAGWSLAMRRPCRIAWILLVPAALPAPASMVRAQPVEEERLWAFREEVVRPMRWRPGDRLEIQLPVQATTYRWDLMASRSRGATKLGRFFDDSEPPRFSFKVRKLTPEEQERHVPRSGGVLGRVDQVQTIPVELGDVDRVVLTFRQYDTLQQGPPGDRLIRVTLDRLP